MPEVSGDGGLILEKSVFLTRVAVEVSGAAAAAWPIGARETSATLPSVEAPPVSVAYRLVAFEVSVGSAVAPNASERRFVVGTPRRSSAGATCLPVLVIGTSRDAAASAT